jgi:hypothetical protein
MDFALRVRHSGHCRSRSFGPGVAARPRCLVALALLSALWLAEATPAELPAALRAAEQTMRAQLGRNAHLRSTEVFVCGGNVSKQEFDAIVDGTVAAAAKALWKQYFDKRPTEPLRVYLFGDPLTYRFYARTLFGDTGVSRFGYYRPDQQALVMDISTGAGTLVHELVHALMEPDFPNAPTWFSEGLASLYEQCRIEEKGLTGLVNWRLPFLQKGIEGKTALPLNRLVALSREEFLRDPEGVYYAQARYLCQYLQERGVLTSFYRAFRDGHAQDPTGASTLEKALGAKLAEVEKAWLEWVGTLRLPDAR